MKKTSTIKLAYLIIILSIIVTATGCATKPKEAMKLKVGIIPIADVLTLFVAQDKGFFEGENLEVESVAMAGGAVIAPAVESGELDIGFSNTISIIIAHEKGLDFKFLTPGAFKDLGNTEMIQLVVQRDSTIRNPKDLEGKTVAINTYKNIQELALRIWADKKNVNYDKFNVVEVPFPQMESALENKEIDAAYFVEPFPTLSISNGVARVLDDKTYDTVADRLLIASWFAKQSWIDANPKKAKAFISAMTKADKYIIEHPAEMPEILSNNTRLTKELAGKIILPTFKESMKKDDIQVMIEASQKYGFIEQSFDAEDIVIDDLKLE